MNPMWAKCGQELKPVEDSKTVSSKDKESLNNVDEKKENESKMAHPERIPEIKK